MIFFFDNDLSSMNPNFEILTAEYPKTLVLEKCIKSLTFWWNKIAFSESCWWKYFRPWVAAQSELADYYIADAITRSLKVMAKCVKYARDTVLLKAYENSSYLLEPACGVQNIIFNLFLRYQLEWVHTLGVLRYFCKANFKYFMETTCKIDHILWYN